MNDINQVYDKTENDQALKCVAINFTYVWGNLCAESSLPKDLESFKALEARNHLKNHNSITVAPSTKIACSLDDKDKGCERNMEGVEQGFIFTWTNPNMIGATKYLI